MPKIEIYINSENKEYFDTLRAKADIEGISFSPALGEAVKYFLSNGVPYLLAEKSKWDGLLKGLSKNEMLELHRLISELNNMILGKLYVK